MRQLKIRLANVDDREKLLEFRRVAFETEPEIWLPDELDLDEIRKNIDKCISLVRHYLSLIGNTSTSKF